MVAWDFVVGQMVTYMSMQKVIPTRRRSAPGGRHQNRRGLSPNGISPNDRLNGADEGCAACMELGVEMLGRQTQRGSSRGVLFVSL